MRQKSAAELFSDRTSYREPLPRPRKPTRKPTGIVSGLLMDHIDEKTDILYDGQKRPAKTA